MLPLIAVGSVIRVAPLPAEGAHALKRFDIVLFEASGKLMCHYFWHLNRIAEPDGSLLCVTRGLANPYEDLPLPESSILGIVVNYRISRWRRALLLWHAWRSRTEL